MKRKTLGKILLRGGLIVGGITAACFVLLMMAAVGIGMGGGLRGGRQILYNFQIIGGISLAAVIIGTILCLLKEVPARHDEEK